MSRFNANSNPRFSLDIPAIEKARLMRAAALEHKTLEDFLLRNALRAADVVIEGAERIELSDRDTQTILDLLDNPREPSPRLVAALKAREAR